MSCIRFQNVFRRLRLVTIGMLHVPALPGTPANRMSMPDIIQKVLHEAEIYSKAGIDALMVENMHDVPYIKKNLGPEIVSAMSILGYEVKSKTKLPCGLQILAAANKEALGACKAAGLDFVRVEGYVYSHVADEGFIDSCAGEILRYRKSINADDILIFADIKKKHSSHAITADVDTIDSAKAAQFCRSDGVIITGSSTGDPPLKSEVNNVIDAVDIPVLVGSGVTLENIDNYARANALIVGSYFKKDGYWFNDLEKVRIDNFLRCVRSIRENSDYTQ
ncbi:Uncharacterized protein F13E9.13, mitochondrial [Trichoplax sp. H2]|uniref:BtpA family membrane complex biogenesis protein n=1 Tax=Trichoplax adhaerens TaxID=10228 RepID=B3RV76_TRIAD|nr:hypothetical protein TRIADDRAFT_55554 [Trichoplax adhaerens]EDV25453.1 hypothetical protein TRIADDRAFT_55554 [Trichoplax adhaerens]RDD44167.1 Uncharacterized protein F13E9.13, mitochondrial [Trichoplax sp. H2]|eukprot:XP_002111486.1 hypothetical protein TRIADDRAFT_55554 [Trichoplax adhaerens]